MDSSRAWLEMELARQLRPVAAPDALWTRIHRKPASRPMTAGWVLWPALAIVVMFASGDLVWQMATSGASMRHIAQITGRQLRILTNASPACDFWSGDPVEIRNWVKAKGNIDVDLPSERNGGETLVGVKLIQAHGNVLAAMAYRGSEGEGALLVSNFQPACLTCHVEAHGQL